MRFNMAVTAVEGLPSGPPPLPPTPLAVRHSASLARPFRQLVCFLSKFEIRVADERARQQRSAEWPLHFVIALANWRMLAVQSSDGSMFSAFELASMTVDDRSAEERPHGNLTRRMLHGDSTLRYVRFVDGDALSFVTLRDAQLVVVAGRLTQLHASLRPKLTELLAGWGVWAAAMAGQQQEQQRQVHAGGDTGGGDNEAAAERAAAQHAAFSSATQRFCVAVESPELHLVDETDERASALRSTATFFVRYDYAQTDPVERLFRHHFDCALRNAAMSRCALAVDRDTHTDVVKPFDVSAALDSQRELGTLVRVNVSLLEVMLSYRDVKLLAGTATRFYASASALAPAAAAAPAAASVVAEQDLQLELGGASVILVNDCADANDPLLAIALERAMLVAQNWSHVSSALAFASLRIAIDNYDVDTQQWASLVEPWSVQIKWQRRRLSAEQQRHQALEHEHLRASPSSSKAKRRRPGALQ